LSGSRAFSAEAANAGEALVASIAGGMETESKNASVREFRFNLIEDAPGVDQGTQSRMPGALPCFIAAFAMILSPPYSGEKEIAKHGSDVTVDHSSYRGKFAAVYRAISPSPTRSFERCDSPTPDVVVAREAPLQNLGKIRLSSQARQSVIRIPP
jgi:hypothetical protein